MLGQKTFWGEENFGPKFFGAKKYSGQQIWAKTSGDKKFLT